MINSNNFIYCLCSRDPRKYKIEIYPFLSRKRFIVYNCESDVNGRGGSLEITLTVPLRCTGCLAHFNKCLRLDGEDKEVINTIRYLHGTHKTVE